MAVRVSLPGVLRAICEHAEAVGRGLEAEWPTAAILHDVEPHTIYTVQASVPTFPPELIGPLTQTVEHCDDAPVIERIASIFREAQVLDTRTRVLGGGEALSLGQLAEIILEAATLYARAESLFAFGRGNSKTVDPEPLWDRMFSVLNIMQIRNPMVRAEANRQRASDMDPGEADTLAF